MGNLPEWTEHTWLQTSIVHSARQDTRRCTKVHTATAILRTRVRATPDFGTSCAPLRLLCSLTKIWYMCAHTHEVSAHMQRQRQQTTTRGLSPSGRTLQEDGLDEDVVGHKAAARRANAAHSPPGSCQLIAVPQLQLLPPA